LGGVEGGREAGGEGGVGGLFPPPLLLLLGEGGWETCGNGGVGKGREGGRKWSE